LDHEAVYVQPHGGAGHFDQATPKMDEKTTTALVAIGQKL
jgi:hypothetical protein